MPWVEFTICGGNGIFCLQLRPHSAILYIVVLKHERKILRRVSFRVPVLPFHTDRVGITPEKSAEGVSVGGGNCCGCSE